MLRCALCLCPFELGNIRRHYDSEVHLISFHGRCRSKLAVGLLSGSYSKAPEDEQHGCEQDGIPPAMLKRIVGKGHPEFSTNKQQVPKPEPFLHQHLISSVSTCLVFFGWPYDVRIHYPAYRLCLC